jgi:hypothetical protein
VSARPGYDADDVAEILQRIQRDFDEKGISADVDVELAPSGGGMRPIVNNIRLKTRERPMRDVVVSETAIESVAQADAGNISEVAASQLKISDNYYQAFSSRHNRASGRPSLQQA